MAGIAFPVSANALPADLYEFAEVRNDANRVRVGPRNFFANRLVAIEDYLDVLYARKSLFLNMVPVQLTGQWFVAANADVRGIVSAWVLYARMTAANANPATAEDLVKTLRLFFSIHRVHQYAHFANVLTYHQQRTYGDGDFIDSLAACQLQVPQRLIPPAPIPPNWVPGPAPAAGAPDPTVPGDAVNITVQNLLDVLEHPANAAILTMVKELNARVLTWVLLVLTSGGTMTARRITRKTQGVTPFGGFPFNRANLHAVSELVGNTLLRPEIALGFKNSLINNLSIPVAQRTMIEQMDWTRLSCFAFIMQALKRYPSAPWGVLMTMFGDDTRNLSMAMKIIANAREFGPFMGYVQNPASLSSTRYGKLGLTASMVLGIRGFAGSYGIMTEVDRNLCSRFAGAVRYNFSQLNNVSTVDIAYIKLLREIVNGEIVNVDGLTYTPSMGPTMDEFLNPAGRPPADQAAIDAMINQVATEYGRRRRRRDDDADED